MEIINLASSRKSSSLSSEPDILAPHQYLKNYRRVSPAEPEKARMLAVLAEAVDTYQRFVFSDSSRRRVLFREAEAWFWDEKPDSVFSFRSICEVFGLDPSFLRRGLNALDNKSGSGSRHREKKFNFTWKEVMLASP